jgi:hydrogenase nickel incorporation protein HypA/HybF
MHEAGLMQNVLEMSFECAKAHNAARIEGINVRIGMLAGVVPDALEFAFEAMKKGTMAENARLNVEYAPVVCWCRKCEQEFKPENFSSACPMCGKNDIEIRSGLEMNLISVEVPDHV